MAIELSGKVAVVTGAASGIGRSTAKLLASRGVTVHVADINGDGAAVVAAEISGAGVRSAEAHTLDVTEYDGVRALAATLDAAGGVDILHNNAGIGVGGPIEDMEIEDWRRAVEVNLMGVVHGIHAFLPGMLERRRPAYIVNTASAAGLVPSVQMSAYTATKYAVVGLSEVLAAELRDREIYVSAICPGIIDTGIVATATMRGSAAKHQARAVEVYDRFGTSPDKVARDILNAIERRKVIRTSPRWHVVPSWIGHRLSIRLGQFLAKGSERLLLKRD